MVPDIEVDEVIELHALSLGRRGQVAGMLDAGDLG